MRIVALIDIHPLDGGPKRGLSMRISSANGFFDLPVSKEQAALLLSKAGPSDPPPPAPPSDEEVSLFAQFTSEVGLDQDPYDDEDDDL